MKKAILLLAQGAEEMEVVITMDVLRRGGVDAQIVGIAGRAPVVCSRWVQIIPDIGLKDVLDKEPVDAVIVPGGSEGSEILAADPNVGKLLRAYESQGKIIAAICAGPKALQSHSIGLGKKVTSYHSLRKCLAEDYDFVEAPVVTDGVNTENKSLSEKMAAKRALVLLAKGAEEMEVVITVDVLRRGGVSVQVVGLEGPETVVCSREVKIVPDVGIAAVLDEDPVDAIVIPGGLKGAEALAADSTVGKLLKSYESGGKIVAAICAGPTVFKSHSIGLGKKLTSYPSFKDKLAADYTYLEDRVVEDGNMVTSRGPGTAFEFGLVLVEKLCGKEKSDSVAGPMLVKVMFALINKILDWFKSLFWKEEMELTLVGLQYSGKTTFVNVIASGQFSEDMIPTVGFNMRKVTKGNVTIKIWDIGGQPRFRSMWERYCRGVSAIVYMVDAADQDKLEASRTELHNLLDKPQLAGIPVLVLGNKKDLPNALDEKGLIERMNLSAVQDREICCYSVSCKEKQNIDITLQWLIAHSKSGGR
ncbi:unnamed protein product [Notodromas monacha]|uniref:DJ-1/PfpI domain-containing protein n=1 Tax=Notodromas monacha TaxID=399045 RepID=A0A7R9GFU2_9CRUS|nr:unnamed protein product [Notodromas monacha]CAG0921032.1 unnamed protein product [Notodromas monacha]